MMLMFTNSFLLITDDDKWFLFEAFIGMYFVDLDDSSTNILIVLIVTCKRKLNVYMYRVDFICVSQLYCMMAN